MQPIFLVRHGETEWNVARRLQGHLDSPLTRQGIDQARAVGRTLRELIGSAGAMLVCSPLGRCTHTARLISEELSSDMAEWRLDPLLKEITWGDWDGLTLEEIDRRAPGALLARRSKHWTYVPPDGESYEMVMRRADAFLASIANRSRPVVVVTHGAIGRVIRGTFAGMSTEEIVLQDEPQHAFFVLGADGIRRIEASTDHRKPAIALTSAEERPLDR